MVRPKAQQARGVQVEISDDPLPIPEAFAVPTTGEYEQRMRQPIVGSEAGMFGDETGARYDDTPQVFVGGDPLGVVLPAQPGEGVAYASRIQVTEAWRFVDNTSLQTAPDFIDKNWLGFETFSEYSPHKPGPVLRVPDPNSEYPKICRVGDYVVKQAVTIDKGMPPIEQIEVWPAADFHRIFLLEKAPVATGAGQPAAEGN